jgi:hypothetical protein
MVYQSGHISPRHVRSISFHLFVSFVHSAAIRPALRRLVRRSPSPYRVHARRQSFLLLPNSRQSRSPTPRHVRSLTLISRFFTPFTPPAPSSSPLLRLVIMVACVEYCLLHLHVPELPPIRCCFITPFPTLCDLPRSACRPLWSDSNGRSNLGRLLDLSLRRPTHGRAIWCETARNMNATSGINKNKIQNN